MAVFPHMNDTEFPNVQNVNVYKYENELDYSRYDYTQMKLCLCDVPWDMGEAHVGARTISGIGNVVYFGNAMNGFRIFPITSAFVLKPNSKNCIGITR